MIDPSIEQKMDLIAENIFGASKDPDQIPITKESGEKLDKLTPNWIKYKLDEKGDPITWAVVLPTSLDLANRFLKGEISERQLLDLTKPQEKYEAIYLCAAITVPEHRLKGLATKLLIEAVDSIPHTDDVVLFTWPFSEEGKKLIKKLSSVFNKKIIIRNK